MSADLVANDTGKAFAVRYGHFVFSYGCFHHAPKVTPFYPARKIKVAPFAFYFPVPRHDSSGIHIYQGFPGIRSRKKDTEQDAALHPRPPIFGGLGYCAGWRCFRASFYASPILAVLSKNRQALSPPLDLFGSAATHCGGSAINPPPRFLREAD